MTYGHGILIGFAQMLSLDARVSRARASTITAGLLLGYERPAAARYGFLLAIPAVFGSGLYELVHSFGEPRASTALRDRCRHRRRLLRRLAVIAFLMSYISKHWFLPFVIYRILLGRRSSCSSAWGSSTQL